MRCRSHTPKKPYRVRARVFAAAGALLCLEALVTSAARAQNSQNGASGTINLGGRGWSASETTSARSTDGAAGELEFSARAGIASDYIYRGITLSDRMPAIGAAAEAALASFYAGIAVASVKLPTQPAAEITMTGGVRRTIGNINLDFGVAYFAYPGETMPGPTDGINYWELSARADTRIGEASASPVDLHTRRTSRRPAPGGSMRRPGSASTCRAVSSRETSAHRSRVAPDIPGSEIRLRRSAAFRCPPISIGKPASP